MSGTLTAYNDLALNSILAWAILGLIAWFVFSWIFDKSPKNLPPGPRGWGTSWKILKASVNGELHELATVWARQYGPLVYVKSFGKQLCFMNSPDMVRRLLASEEFKLITAHRLPSKAAKLGLYNDKNLIFFNYDAIGKKKRRILHKVLGLYGDNVGKFESVVRTEVERLSQELEQHENEDFELWRSLIRSLKSVIYILTLGELPPDPDTPDVLEEFDIAFNKVWHPANEFVLTIFPFMAKIPGRFKTAVDRLAGAKKRAEELIYYTPMKTHVPGKPRGIMDYLVDTSTKPGNEFLAEDTEHIKGLLLSLFLASHLTSRATLMGTFLSLMNYPKVTKKIQEEIDRVLGNQEPRVEDRASMPYTEATILEILRIGAVSALGGVRTVAKDIHIDGMTIPQNTVLYINMWYFHHNEELWEDPWAVKPERFLNSNGQLLPADDPVRKNNLSFGTGARSCPGEALARSRVFLFVTNILQKYDILRPAHEEPVPADFATNYECTRGFLRQSLPFKCRLRRRQKN